MLPRKLKIPKSLIPLVIKSGKSNRSPSLMIRVLEKKELESSLFTVVIAKKVSKKATDRNLIKRRIYNAIRFYLRTIKPGFMFLIMPQNESLKTNLEGFKKEINEMLIKNNLLN